MMDISYKKDSGEFKREQYNPPLGIVVFPEYNIET